MRSVCNQSKTENRDERYAGIWMDESYAAHAAGVVWVGLWGDTTVAAALPAARVACTVCGVVAVVVPGGAVAEVCPLNQRRGSR